MRIRSATPKGCSDRVRCRSAWRTDAHAYPSPATTAERHGLQGAAARIAADLRARRSVPGMPSTARRIGRSARPVRVVNVTPHRLAGCLCRCAGQNDGVDVGVVLNAVNAELGSRWQVERRLAGGWNEGAYLLSRPGGPRAVLKWRASEPERLLGARERVEVARARGWPAPAWLATGRAPAGGAWVVQEFIDGRPPPHLDDAVAEQRLGVSAEEPAQVLHERGCAQRACQQVQGGVAVCGTH
jgi:hypothetical protein